MDGVLFDTTELSKKFAHDQYPSITDEMHAELLCGNFHEEMAKIAHLKKQETEEEANARKRTHTENKLKCPMYNGAKELLETLHEEGHTLALNSSAFEKNCLPLLEKHGVVSLFDFLGTAEVSKSKIDKFKIIEEKYGFGNKDTFFITDTLGDIREADIANVPTIAVTWGAHDKSYFTKEEHKNMIGIADTFEELKDLIDRT